MDNSDIIVKDGAALISSSTDDSVPFSEVEGVAKSWMLDFLFISACHFFKEDKQKEYSQAMQSLEAMLEGARHLKTDQKVKMDICCFLSRIVHGKRLDVQFDDDQEVTPLLSALRIWTSLRDTVADKILHEKIQTLLFIQSVGVCLEKGNHTMASWVLDWLIEECDMPENLKMKLSLIVKKSDTYHPFLTNCSFDRLVKSISKFLDLFLKAHPSDFLLKAASKVVLTCREQESGDSSVSGSALQHGDDSRSKENQSETSPSAANENQNHEASQSAALPTRPIKRLLLRKNFSPWKPDTGKMPYGIFMRKSNIKGAQLTKRTSAPVEASDHTMENCRKRRQKWTYEEDRELKAGVKRYGEGKWSKILQEFDFEDRTGVMLKDRWRTLKKLGLVD